MSEPSNDDLPSLRGSLPPASNTARDLAITVRTRCARRRTLAVVGANADAAAKLLGPMPPSGQSPFAINAGNQFELVLRRDGAARLREALAKALPDVLESPDALAVEDLDVLVPWKSRPSSGDVSLARRKRTSESMRRCMEGELGEPMLVLHPRFRFQVFGSERDLEPDGLLLLPAGRNEEPELLLVEIKAFVDHGHRTDLHDLAQTRLQLAVYALALEQAARVDGLSVETPGDAVVVLRRAHSMFGIAGVEEIRREVERVRRAVDRGPQLVAEVLQLVPQDGRLDDASVLGSVPVRYAPGFCLSGCAMALQCREASSASGDPAYYGSPVSELLHGAGDLVRAHALIKRELQPTTPAEAEISERLGALRMRIDAARTRCT